MKRWSKRLFVTLSDPRKVRLIWLAAALLALAVAGGAPMGGGWDCYYC